MICRYYLAREALLKRSTGRQCLLQRGAGPAAPGAHTFDELKAIARNYRPNISGNDWDNAVNSLPDLQAFSECGLVSDKSGSIAV